MSDVEGVGVLAFGVGKNATNPCGKSEISKISFLLIILSLSLITLGSFVFGILGVPIAMVCVYLILTLLITRVLKKVTSVG